MSAKYQNIQILRIIACIGVFCVHTGQRLEFGGVLRKITDFGSRGVTLFFIISGFVTFLSLDNKGGAKAGRYYINRFIRIAPVYYFIVLYNFILHVFIQRDVPEDIFHLGWLRYFLCLNIIVPSNNSFWNNAGATWTIFVFMLFYLLVPIIRKWCTNLRNTLILWGIFFSLSFINILDIDNGLFPLRHIHYIMIGVIIYFALKEKKDKIFIFVSVALVICRGVALPVIDWLVWPLLFSILVISSMELKTDNPWIIKIVNKMDEYTYTIYFVHVLGLQFMESVYKSHIVNSKWKFIALVIGILSTIFLSIIVHEMIEKPIQKRLRR